MPAKVKIAIINGPNLNLLGTREPDIYGNRSFENFFSELKQNFSEVELSYFQSNVEGELINALQKCQGQVDGVILNPGGYTHTSVAIGDCIAAISVPVVEVHISNIMAREPERRYSFVSRQCLGSISGFGLQSYVLALKHFLAQSKSEGSN